MQKQLKLVPFWVTPYSALEKILAIPLVAGLMYGGIASAPDVLAEQQPQQQEQTIEQRADDVYVDLGYAPGRLNVNGSTLEEYREEITNFFKSYRPGIERDEIGFEALVDTFAQQAVNQKGSILEATFNNIVDDHRNYIEIARAVDSYDNINPTLGNWIKEFSADAFIKRGANIDISSVKKRLDKIPDEYHIVKTKKEDTVEGIISQHYNRFAQLNQQEKRRVLDFVYEINPASISHGFYTDDKSKVTYLLRMGYEDRAIVAVPKSDFLDKVASGQK